ncbi:ABC transporter substrate-binding protein [bacterium RCC_150]
MGVGATLAIWALAGCGANSTVATSAAKGIDVPADIEQAGVISIASDLAYPPFDYLDESGQPAGIEVDMAKAVGKKMGVRVEFHKIDFPSVVPSIANRRYDMATDEFADTPERQKVVSFVDWYRVVDRVQVLAGNSKNLTGDDLCGHSFPVVTGSYEVGVLDRVGNDCKKANKPEPEVLTFQDAGAMQQALANGRADGLLSNAAASAYAVTTSQGKLTLAPGDVGQSTGRVAGFVFPKDNDALVKAVVQSINALKADGTWDTILRTHGIQEYAVTPVTVNTQPYALGSK